MNYRFLEEQVKMSQIPKMEFYATIGVTPEGYRGMIKNESMRIDILEKISESLKIPIWKFFFSEKPEMLLEHDYKSKYIVALEENFKLHKELKEVQQKTINSDALQQSMISIAVKLEGITRGLAVNFARISTATEEDLLQELRNITAAVEAGLMGISTADRDKKHSSS